MLLYSMADLQIHRHEDRALETLQNKISKMKIEINYDVENDVVRIDFYDLDKPDFWSVTRSGIFVVHYKNEPEEDVFLEQFPSKISELTTKQFSEILSYYTPRFFREDDKAKISLNNPLIQLCGWTFADYQTTPYDLQIRILHGQWLESNKHFAVEVDLKKIRSDYQIPAKELLDLAINDVWPKSIKFPNTLESLTSVLTDIGFKNMLIGECEDVNELSFESISLENKDVKNVLRNALIEGMPLVVSQLLKTLSNNEEERV